ncbi:hypothetical protein [Falsihalocynthiibacter arcticus]|uniref:Uncharacterized protein n=1 Tax=Falsihalocynthiibacter arcticus TaxID=1579316 RepID=A0A126V585_9RHOB|nr:hypothetical protein [Falsihalocynthiibacter arcticus]AML52859.1 hypothetical protein RC74_17770 [Falsihalocynthiibacter arcticus]
MRARYDIASPNAYRECSTKYTSARFSEKLFKILFQTEPAMMLRDPRMAGLEKLGRGMGSTSDNGAGFSPLSRSLIRALQRAISALAVINA